MFGYPAVAIVVALESFGIPVPGETILLIAAVYATTGRLNIVAVVAAALGGAISDDNFAYWAARRLIQRVPDDAVLCYGRWLRLHPEGTRAKLARGAAFFARYGPVAVALGRFGALLRSFIAVLAGVSRMPYGTFVVYNALGITLWAVTYGLLGYLLGSNWTLLQRVVRDLGFGTFALVAALVSLLALIWTKRQRHWPFGGPTRE
jgi:membrane protein DedA with SNARE-associated domain